MPFKRKKTQATSSDEGPDAKKSTQRDEPGTSGSQLQKQPEFPKDTMPLYHQMAGHRHGKGKTKLGLLLHGDGSILKPVVKSDIRSQRERDFYVSLDKHAKSCTVDIEKEPEKCSDAVLHGLIPITPRYLGDFDTEYIAPGSDGEKVSYVKLEDLARSFEFPCLVDIKIGRIIYGPDATPEKIKMLEAKFLPRKVIGYQLLTMRIYEDGKPKQYGPEYCDTLTEGTIVDGLKKFISTNPKALPKIIDSLEKINNWFQKQRRFSFFGSSILIIYEAKGEHVIVRMIDFAHVHPTDKEDENYTYGLKNLLRDFKKCI